MHYTGGGATVRVAHRKLIFSLGIAYTQPSIDTRLEINCQKLSWINSFSDQLESEMEKGQKSSTYVYFSFGPCDHDAAC